MPAATMHALAVLMLLARACAATGDSDPVCDATSGQGECGADAAVVNDGASADEASAGEPHYKNLVGPAAAALGARGQRTWRAASETDDTMGVYLEGADDMPPLSLNAGDIVERCMCLTVHLNDIDAELRNKTKHNYFDRGLEDDSPVFVPFGWCGLYNEAPADSTGPNLMWEHDDLLGAHVITLRALRHVNAGEELTVRRAKASFAVHPDRDFLRTALRLANVSVELQTESSLPERSVQMPSYSDLDVRVDEHGVAVHAMRRFEAGEMIELIPNLVFEGSWGGNTQLTEWSYYSHLRDGLNHLPYGYISFFRTANVSNVEYTSGIASEGTAEAMSVSTMALATRDIEPGEELVLDAKWGHDKGEDGDKRPSHDSGREWRPSELDGEQGMFATWSYEKGDVVDFCLAWQLGREEVQDFLWPYLYQVPADSDDDRHGYFAIGWCSLYNADPADGGEPNLVWEASGIVDGNNKTRPAVRLVAARPIAPGDELLVARGADTSLGTRGLRRRLESMLKRPSQRVREHLRPPAEPLMPKKREAANLEIRASPTHGIGVFALRDFKDGELIESAVKMHLTTEGLPKTLTDYTFQSSTDPDIQAAALGLGMLYNHDEPPNVQYYTHPDCVSMFVQKHCQLMEYFAARDIQAGEELFISYGASYWEARPGRIST